MSDYAHTTTVRRPADDVFAYLSDIGNLPQYFEAMESAESAGHQAVHVVANVEGQRREGEAWLAVDSDARRLQWGSEGPNDYHGELTVTPSGNGGGESEVQVFLRTERADGPGIRAGLEQTLANLKQILDGSSVEMN
jgi:uncharacterized membrane protein